jgi:general secretion pathway protein A
MYETFFGLTERPFSLRPDPAFLYLSHQHSLALSMLEFSLTGQAGFVVVTGEIGSGKTTLIRHFLRQSDRSTTIGFISNTHAGMGDILQWVLQALNIETTLPNRPAGHQALLKYLAQQAIAGRQVVLIVDEAQNLSIAALEELRLLSNIDLDKDNTLQIALVGQPELLEKLQRPELRQFAQRISVHYHLMPLTYLESCGYIRHRLSVAGAKREIFDGQATGAIYYFSSGVPRVMNSICDMAMVYGYAAGRACIGLDLVLAVVRDREKHGVQVLARRATDISRDALIESIAHRFGEPDPQPMPSDIVLDAVVRPASSTVHVNGAPDGPIQLAPRSMDDDMPSAPFRASHANGRNETCPPVTAFYLPEEVFYRDGVLDRRKPGAFQWLRRHLGPDRGQS